MTVQEAIQNIENVVSSSLMNCKDHAALQQSVALVAQQCKLAEELAKEKTHE